MKIEVYSNLGEKYVPKRAEGSIGYDVVSPKEIVLDKHNPYCFLDLGIILKSVNTPDFISKEGLGWGYEIIPRSSSSKSLLKFSNTIGVVDPNYSGPKDTLKVALEFNCGNLPDNDKRYDSWGVIGEHVYSGKWNLPSILIKEGERIGQLVFKPVLLPDLVYAGSIDNHPNFKEENSSRGGFGSTGK